MNQEFKKKRFVAMLDIMGFKHILQNQKDEEIYNLLKLATEEAEQFEGISSVMFSDSIFLISQDDSKESFSAIVYASGHIEYSLIKQGYAINGAISYGDVVFDKQTNICFGCPLKRAYDIQSNVFFYGIVLDEHAQNRLAELGGSSIVDNSLISDFVTDLMVPLKDKGWQKMYCVNWPELFCTGPSRKDPTPTLRKIITKHYMNLNESSQRGHYYVMNTELVLKQWLDFTGQNNSDSTWGELICYDSITKCPCYTDESNGESACANRLPL